MQHTDALAPPLTLVIKALADHMAAAGLPPFSYCEPIATEHVVKVAILPMHRGAWERSGFQVRDEDVVRRPDRDWEQVVVAGHLPTGESIWLWYVQRIAERRQLRVV